jgi:hypothetical protein
MKHDAVCQCHLAESHVYPHASGAFQAVDFPHDLTLYPEMSDMVCLSSNSPGILRLSGKVSASLR